MPGPTDQEQLYLELINEARIDPMRNAARYISSYAPLHSNDSQIQNAFDYFDVSGADLLAAYQALVPVAPVAWNANLATAAEKHTAAMMAGDQQSHQLPGELGLGDRIRAEGYSFTRAGENVYAYSLGILYGHAGFMVDWGNGPGGMQSPAGHRINIMSANFSEVGIDVTAEGSSATSVGPMLVTQDFAERGLNFVLGVAYTDSNHDQFYSIGEGRGDLQVGIGANTVTSFATGGYSLGIGSGLQTITLSGGGLSGAVTVKTTVASDSIKLDVVDGTTLLTSGSIEVSGGVSTIRGIGTLYGGLTITAGSGNERVIGTIGNDTLNGGAGNDMLEGGDGSDTLNGGDGNDEFRGGAGADMIIGGTGNDVVVYAGAHTLYTLANASNGRISVNGADSGGDLLDSIEILRFADGDFFWNAALGQLTTGANTVPTVAPSQSIVVVEDGSLQFTVVGSDGDGDALTFAGSSAAHGTVSGGAGGAFVYTPDGNYNGSDSFIVTVADGRGGTATQTVSVSVLAQNDAPTVAASQSITADANSARQFIVKANDVDGDTLGYTAGTAAHGSVSGGAGGVFAYTPTTGYAGSDSFVVMVNDGHGGTASQTIAVTVNAAPAPDPQPSTGTFRLFATGGFTGEIGGSGAVFGTQGFQEITIVDQPGSVSLDPSFNRGGDVVRLSGNASGYTAAVFGSSLLLDHGSTEVAIPIGTAGIRLVFDDGARTMLSIGASVKIGSQTVSSVASAITASPDNAPLPGSENADATARLFLSPGAGATVGGNYTVFGTAAAEEVTYRQGDLILDPSFNRGGDKLFLPDAAFEYSAYVSGSTAVVTGQDGAIFIPIGSVGLAIDFAGEQRVLRYDAASATVLLGDVALTGSTAANPVPLAAMSTEVSEEPTPWDDSAFVAALHLDTTGGYAFG